MWNFFVPKDFHAGYNVHLNAIKIARVIVLTYIYLHFMACVLQFWTLIDCKNPKETNFTECLYEFRDTTWLGTKKGMHISCIYISMPLLGCEFVHRYKYSKQGLT